MSALVPFDYNAWKREWRQKHPERSREIARESKRREYRNPERRAVILARSHAYYEAHRTERAEYQKRWADANREKVLRQASERYRRTDPRKRFAQGANRRVTQYGRPDELLDWTTLPEGPWTCRYCGTPCESWDHVEQLALGGPNTAANLVPCCLPCNQKRSRFHRPRTTCRKGHPWEDRRCRVCQRDGYLRRKRAAEEAAA